MNVTERLLHLHGCEEVTSTMLQLFLELDPTLGSFYRYSPTKLHQFLHHKIPLDKINLICKYLHSVSFASMLEKYKSQNIQWITRLDTTYPVSLEHIYNPPWVLYTKGNHEILHHNKLISIVGTRTPTSYGNKMTHHFVRSLVEKEWTTVSGLAKGIDALVHQETINHNGITIAILGSGFNYLYPKVNQPLAELIMKKGLLVTEYPPNRKPQKWHFPARNRIISGVSLGTIVIEAKEKSGSLITANMALDQNREVFAVPGPVDSSYSKGTNLLIQQGAKMVLTPEDVITELKYQIYE